MSNFIPTPAGDGWASIAEALEGKKWPEAAAVTDLRWWVDQRAKDLWKYGVEEPTHEQLIEGIPGRPTLIKRWGWTDHAVRTLLAAPALWWDDHKWGPQVSPADRQPSANGSPADRQPRHGVKPKTRQVSPADRQPSANGSPADLHTRGDPQPQPQPQVDDGDRAQAREAPGDPIEEAVAELMALQASADASTGAKPPTSEDAETARGRLRQGHTKATLRVLWDWSGITDDPLVHGCRRGWRRFYSLASGANGEERIRRALAWHDAGRPLPRAALPPPSAGPPARASPPVQRPSSPRRGQSTAGDGGLMRVAGRLNGTAARAAGGNDGDG